MAKPEKSDSNKFLWFRDLPIWGGVLGGLGTIALAIIAFHTLGPVVENFQLRDHNSELRKSNKKLQKTIEGSKLEKRQLTGSLEHLKIQIKDAKEQGKNLQKHQNDLMKAIIKISGNVSTQVERERKLTERLEKLQTERQNLQTTKARLKTEKSRLTQERSEIQGKLRQAQGELGRIGEELKNTYQINRRFILQQIKTKILNSYPEIKQDDFPSSFDHPVSPLRPFSFNKIKGAYFIGDIPVTGKEFVIKEFDSQVFLLLPETYRILLQDAIRKFIDKNKNNFSEDIAGSFKIQVEYYSKKMMLESTKGSTLFKKEFLDEDYRMVYGLLFGPKSVSRAELKVRESKYQKAKSAYTKEIKRIIAARKALNDAMDRMIVEVRAFK